MTIWEKAEAWVKSWNGVLTLLGAISVAFAATRKAVQTFCGRIVALVRFYVNVDKRHAEALARLDGLDRGQLDIIQTRSAIMDADERCGFFRCDAAGQCVWVSELYRQWTGLSSEEATGYGWEMGILEADRPRVIQNWMLAVDHKRRYEDTLSYCNRITGKITRAKVIASPVKDNDGSVLSWTGIAKAI